MSAAQLWAQLSAANLVEGELPEPDHSSSPWYVRVMLGIAGWIGALFLLFFVGIGLAFVMEGAAASIIAGILCCTAALAMFRQFDDNDFAEQFALVISLVGQALLAVGFGQVLQIEEPAFYIAIAVTEIVLAIAIPNFLHRVLTSCGAAIAFALAINQLALHGLAIPFICAGLAWIWLEPKNWAVSGIVWRPIGYGLVLALLLVELALLIGGPTLFGLRQADGSWFAIYGPLFGRILSAGVLVWVAVTLTLREGFATGSRVTVAVAVAAVLFGLFSLNAPGLAAALLVLLLGFSAGNRLLMALGILCLLGFVGHFYYSLHANLLEKSALMAVTGVCLLAAHFVLRRLPSSGTVETGHA